MLRVASSTASTGAALSTASSTSLRSTPLVPLSVTRRSIDATNHRTDGPDQHERSRGPAQGSSRRDAGAPCTVRPRCPLPGVLAVPSQQGITAHTGDQSFALAQRPDRMHRMPGYQTRHDPSSGGYRHAGLVEVGDLPA
jgi:hypothetical protein